MGAVVYVIERHDFAEGPRQIGDRCQGRADFLASLRPAIGRRTVRRHRLGRGQRQGLQVLASQHPMRTVTHDAPKPAGERGRIGQGGQRIPGRHEGLLNDVFRLPQVADERQRVAEGHVLEAPDDLAERVEIATRRRAHRRLQLHRALLANKCRDRPAGFTAPGASGPAGGWSMLLPP